MGNNGKGHSDTGLMDAAGGLALIPFFLAAAMIFVIGVAIAFIWVPIVLLVLWAIGRGLWEIGLPQFIWGLFVDGLCAAARAVVGLLRRGWDRCRGKTVVVVSPAAQARAARVTAIQRSEEREFERERQREIAESLRADFPRLGVNLPPWEREI